MSDKRPEMQGWDEMRAGTRTGGIPLDNIFRQASTRDERDEVRADRIRIIRMVCCVVLGTVAVVAIFVAALLDAPGMFAVFGVSAIVAGVCASGVALAR